MTRRQGSVPFGMAMVMVSSFKTKYNKETGFYEVISNIAHRCPYCGGELTYRDRVVRKSKNSAGDILHYLLRRFLCKLCGKLHREIPGCIQPYKHYDSAAIQSVLDGGKDCGAENSTTYRWMRDFKKAEPDISQRLASVFAQMGGDKAPILAANEILTKIRADIGRWLPYVMELLINSGQKLCTQFAFCPLPVSDKVPHGSKIKAERGTKDEQTIADTG